MKTNSVILLHCTRGLTLIKPMKSPEICIGTIVMLWHLRPLRRINIISKIHVIITFKLISALKEYSTCSCNDMSKLVVTTANTLDLIIKANSNIHSTS